ncbi:MAG: hypothetical protein AB2672_03720 [Candidatus Thiodiazotropha endolucinida]|nr:hypothetical protein [Candidatus Thiodiazotropha taylori]MCW4222945.1 hypothetical protein [Candidatus Thiodiazotropha endolucinida]MCG7881509.1 hypothetical protein [Candidatus Thiodiazotropha taylori]MCG7884525.1 hypothetical protein [Candidatus Thiodiazotropha taylori]MCG7891801.1 hypothetical protein [Candidatus Thiodiazotropha taylori]
MFQLSSSRMAGLWTWIHPGWYVAGQRFVEHLPKILMIDSWADDERSWLYSTLRFIVQEARALRPGGETVASLAREVGMSRSGFSTRFTDLVGDSAMRYLTQW